MAADFPIIDWESEDNAVFLNPRLPSPDARELRSWLEPVAAGVQGHVFLLTSGSTAGSLADFKWVALSKRAILASSAAVNVHLDSHRRDTWFHCLPDFHIGGLAIESRATLSGARVARLPARTKWQAARFVAWVDEVQATLGSLVPAQVFDLVTAGLAAPSSLRAVLVGGGALSPALQAQAKVLGWPLLPTYGMTETASQVATAPLAALERPLDAVSSVPLQILPHWEVSVLAGEGRLRVRGDSLLSGYVSQANNRSRLTDPRQDGWFTTEDLGEVSGHNLTLTGRVQDRIKIGGELSHLGRLRRILEAVSGELAPHLALIAVPDPRCENVIQVIAEAAVPEIALIETIRRFNESVLPFERVRGLHRIDCLPRTPLGKIRWQAIGSGARSLSDLQFFR